MKRLFLVFASLPALGVAQDLPKARPMEILPPHLAALVERTRAVALPAGLDKSPELQGVYYRAKRWAKGQTLNVCFSPGADQAVRSRIAQIAKQWEPYANLKLNFGNISDPQICTGNAFYEIRVGYSYKGYWSLVGQDSIIQSAQYDQSMNLEGFNTFPPKEPEFTNTVLHEFGHAVGLAHEHQNFKGNCEAEFNWPLLYQVLAQPPNNWDKAMVDSNMRRLVNDGAVRAVGSFDRDSVMLYRFDDWMYKDGPQSSCYPGQHTGISDGDKATVAEMYPRDGSEATPTAAADTRLLASRLKAKGIGEDAIKKSLSVHELMSAPPSMTKRELVEKLTATPATK